MAKATQLDTVRRLADDEERRRAERVAACERRVAQCEAKLAELTAYQASYAEEFARRAGEGLDGARLRQFQTFLLRLGEALRQQGEIVERARAERDAERDRWRQAAQRAQMVGRVIKHREDDERREQDRREQRAADERGLMRYRHHEQ
jgi:flagellar protein FliJ